MASVPKSAPVTASLVVNVVDGTRGPVKTRELLIRVFDGKQNPVRTGTYGMSTVLFRDLPVKDNLDDRFTVIASAPGYRQAGFTPVVVRAGVVETVNLMLLPADPRLSFRDARWDNLAAWNPQVAALLAAGAASPEAARDRYSQLLENRPASLASLLNLAEAMSAIALPVGSPLSYMKEILWDDSLAQDRFFAWADIALIDQVKAAAERGLFAQEVGAGFFHPGATLSYKQVQFGEANVQLTFHEQSTCEIGGVRSVKIEPDIDYFQDLGAHALLEVVPNAVSGAKTDPLTVYALRWIAGRQAGIPEFDPPYTIIKA